MRKHNKKTGCCKAKKTDFSITTLNSNYSRIRQMSAIQWTGSSISDIYGSGLYQDVAYQQYDPYVLTR